MKDATRIFQRYAGNPIMDARDYPGLARICNPSPVQFGDETLLLISVADFAAKRGYGRDIGQTRIARSKDGIHFELSEENFVDVQSNEYPWTLYHHLVDNRTTRIGDTYYMITPVMVHGWQSPVGMLGKTKDFKTYERIDIITQPPNRGASLFPEKINGKYWKLDRPGGGDGSPGDIWISSSPDLIHWGCFKPVLAPNYRFWNMGKIGPTPPIKTEQGWLDIMHGSFLPAGGVQYYIGAILLDLDEPWKVIGKTNSYLLGPEDPWEQHGISDNCVFPCGLLPNYEKDELRLYYGAADRAICLATGSLSETVEACLKGL